MDDDRAGNQLFGDATAVRDRAYENDVQMYDAEPVTRRAPAVPRAAWRRPPDTGDAEATAGYIAAIGVDNDSPGIGGRNMEDFVKNLVVPPCGVILANDHIDGAMWVISRTVGQVHQEVSTAAKENSVFAYDHVSATVRNAIQVVQVHTNHWIAIRRYKGVVEVADSSGAANINDRDTTIRINQLFGAHLSKSVVSCPQQHNANDCGLFAIACAVDWAHDEDDLMRAPFNTDSATMRQYLQECYRVAAFRHPFPRAASSAAANASMVSANALSSAVRWALGNAATTSKAGDAHGNVDRAAESTPTAVRRRVNPDSLLTPVSALAAATASFAPFTCDADYDEPIRRARVAPVNDGTSNMALRNDEIDAAMVMISRKVGQDFQRVKTAMTDADGYEYVPHKVRNPIQIVLVDGTKWIAMRRHLNEVSKKDEVQIADTSGCAAISRDARTHAAQLFGESVDLHAMRCPLQTYQYDSGVFAIACAVDWACGENDLMKDAFDTNSELMRRHLQSEFHAGYFARQFPATALRAREWRAERSAAAAVGPGGQLIAERLTSARWHK